MWAARQVAIAGIIGYSLFRRSAAMLKVSLLAYALMNFQDAFIGVSLGEIDLIVGASSFCALSAVMIAVVSRKRG
jgi:hypothetical protein